MAGAWSPKSLTPPRTTRQAARWQPEDGIFGPTTGLDPLLFGDNGNLRPQVRGAVMERLDQCIRVDSGLAGSDWQEWLHVYLTGGSASEWAGPRPNEKAQDLDVIVAINLAEAQGCSSFEGMNGGEAASALNAAFWKRFNAEGWQPEFGGTWNLTAFCNQRAQDGIAAIKPYAAYDLTDGRWAVKPPHLPGHSAQDFDPAVMAHARAVLAEARAVLRMPEPLRSREARILWEHVHAHRCVAFSGEGTGWDDPGNIDDKWLSYAPGGVLNKIRDLAMAKTAAAQNQSCCYCGEPLGEEDVADGMSAHEECSDMRWCEACQEHHDDPQEAEEHNEGYTDWGNHLPFEGGIHRGITVRLPPDVHAVVHDGSRPPAERAGALARHLRENPADDSGEPGHAGGYGVHWTDHEPTAQAWGSGEGAMFGPSEEERSGQSSTHVVMHAASPHENHIEDDPGVLAGRNLLGYDHPRSEREVPLKASAPVHLTGISWKPASKQEWTRHDFGQVASKTAARETDDYDDPRKVYLRFGHWPHNERSHNFAMGYDEEGVSAYDLDRRGDPMDPDPTGSARHHFHDESCEPECDLDWMNEHYGETDPAGRVTRAERARAHGRDNDSDTGHLVKGEFVGFGHDAEPLLKNVKRVGDWIDHRHLFLDQAGPHRLARDPSGDDYEPPQEKPPYPRRQGAAVPDRPRTASRGDQLAGMDDNTRASALAQDHVRLLHPLLTRPVETGEFRESPVLTAWLADAGHPRAGEAYVTGHPDPGAMRSSIGYGPDGEPAVMLHPDRRDYGTMAHEVAHHVTDLQTGRAPGRPHGPGGAHGDQWAGNYAGLLNRVSEGAGDDFLAERESQKPGGIEREAAAPGGGPQRPKRTPGSAMVYLDVPHGTVAPYEGQEGGHHVALAYLPRGIGDEDFERVKQRAREAAARHAPMKATIGGGGVFPPGTPSDRRRVAVVPVHAPGIRELHDEFSDFDRAHYETYAPHVTRAQLGGHQDNPPPHPEASFPVTHVHVRRGEEVHSFPLTGPSRREASAGPWLHATPERFAENQLVFPMHGEKANFAKMPDSGGYAHFTDSQDRAAEYRDHVDDLHGPGAGRVYEVQPTGPHEADPEDPYSRRSAHPLRVLREHQGLDDGTDWDEVIDHYNVHREDDPERARHWLNHSRGEGPAGEYGRLGARHEAAADYRQPHQGPDSDDGEALHELGTKGFFPADVHSRPGDYGADSQTASKIRKARGNPDERITMYRAMPSPHHKIHPGDWVTLSEDYAREHAEESNPDSNYAVLGRTTRARYLRNDGNDLNEWTYHGPTQHFPRLVDRGGKNGGWKNSKALHDAQWEDAPPSREAASGPWYHGTQHSFSPGDHVTSPASRGTAPEWNASDPDQSYASTDKLRAWQVAVTQEHARPERGPARVFEVHPTGAMESDPVDDLPSAFQTRHPMRVIRELPRGEVHDAQDERQRRADDEGLRGRQATPHRYRSENGEYGCAECRQAPGAPQHTAKLAVSGYDGLTGRSAMIYLDLPPGAVRPVPGGVDDSHVTLVYLGKDVSDKAFAEACRRVRQAAARCPPMDGVLRGIDIFPPSKSSDGKVVAFVPAYVGGIGRLRRELEDLSASEHADYRPHVTLAYLEEGDSLPAPHPAVPLHFTRVHVKRGDDIRSFPFTGGISREAAGDTVDVYHHTSPESAREIWEQKHFEPFDEYNRVYGTNLPPGVSRATGADYGDAAVHLRLPRGIVHQWDGRPDEPEHYYDIDADDIRPEHFVRVLGSD